jgi:hypothetical protein
MNTFRFYNLEFNDCGEILGGAAHDDEPSGSGHVLFAMNFENSSGIIIELRRKIICFAFSKILHQFLLFWRT